MNSCQESIQPETEAQSSSKVKVALRIRPMINKELIEGSLKCIECIPQTSQIVIGKDKAFTFDRIYDETSSQEEIYRTFVRDLVMGCFNGYNATILAYGQTGSGKTYTMGSSMPIKPEDTGIISRVIREICNEIELRKSKTEFLIKVSFLEIYNEEIYDLLDSTITTSARSKLSKPNGSINIREEKDGSISIYGINEEKVLTYDEMMTCLERGSLHRSTASTLMNEVSSRSHAIFTITLEQHNLDDLYKPKTPTRQQPGKLDTPNTGFMTAKFHFVDLAGSERIKKTGASGNTMREGININRGLLVLGNVISALTDITSKSVHVPYRESKLTRILQDSLGGNSLTGMIACVSPAESNYEESLNTIKYANRARNIQNTPHINRDPQTALISQLKQQIFELQNENVSLKQLLSKSDIKWEDHRTPTLSSRLSISPMNGKGTIDNEQEDLKNLKIRLIQVEKLNKKLQSETQNKQKSINQLEISLYTISKERDLLRLYNERYREGRPIEMEEIQNKQSILESYKAEIEKLKLDIQKKEEFTRELQLEYEQLLISSRKDQDLLLEKIRLLALYKKHIERLEAQRGDSSKDPEKTSQEIDPSSSIQEFTGEEDEEWIEMEKELVSIRNSAENELNHMSGTLKEKEELLRNITENNLELERDLLDVMKNQYHQKISNLEGELSSLIGEVKKIEGQRDKALSQLTHTVNKESDEKNKNIVLNYKHKILQLETQLKDFRKKEKEQLNLQRLVQNQQNKIQELANEIKTIKQQKMQLNRKYREELDKLEKFKTLMNKEKQDWKKKEVEKEHQITKLKTEKEKLSVLMKKKDDEIVNNKKSQELFRNLCNKDFRGIEGKNMSQGVFFTDHKGLLSRRYATRKNTKLFEEKTGMNLELDLSNEENVALSLDHLQEKVIEILELEQKFANEECELKRTETDLEQELKKLSELLLRKEKISRELAECLHDLEEEESLNDQIKEIDVQINELYMRIENLEDKAEFLRRKMIDFQKQSQKFNGGISEIFVNFLQLERCGQKHPLLKGILERWGSLLREMVRMREEINRKSWELNEMANKNSNLEIKYNVAEATFQQNINKIKQEFEEKQLKMLQQQDLYNMVLKESKENRNKANVKERSKTKNDMMEIEANPNTIVNTQKPLNCPNISLNINPNIGNIQITNAAMNQNNKMCNNNDIKLVSFKEKRQLVRQEKLKENGQKIEDKIQSDKSILTEKVNQNNILQNLQPEIFKLKEIETGRSPPKKRDIQGVAITSKQKSSKILLPEPSNPPIFSNFFPEFKDFSSCDRAFLDQQVECSPVQCLFQQNLCSRPIECIKAMDQLIFIANNNGVQVMDLECNRIINEWKLDSQEQRLTSMAINRDRNLLLYCFENQIELRDLCTYQKIETLKARTPVLKDISSQDYMMFTAGKGSISKGGLLVWDLRKMSWSKEMEKNEDIWKVFLKDRILYYGGKAKIVKRLNVETCLDIYPYIQKHTDSIISLTGVKDHVLSGSKDKTIKLWNANNFIENCTDSTNFENSVARTLEGSYLYRNGFYSGGMEGKLGFWGLNSGKIKKIFEFDAHQSSINAVVENSNNHTNVIITGSTDEILKVWRPGEEITSSLAELS